jgi:hypothetical protein
MSFLAFLAALAAQLPAATPAPPTPPAAPAESARLVTIPFDPPLGTPIRYRRTKEVVQARGSISVWNSAQYVITRGDGDGYRMQVTTIGAGVNGGDAATSAMFRRMSAMFGQPYVILLDGQGTILGIENEEAYWNRMMADTERVIAAQEPVDTPEGRAVLSQIVAMLREMPRETRLGMMVEAVAPILELSGTEFTLGEPIESEQQVASPFGGTILRQVTARPERIEAGHLFLTARMTVPREALVAVMEGMSARIPVSGRGHNTEAERARGLEQIRNADFAHATDVTYEVALATGLMGRMRSVERVALGAGTERVSKVTTITLERID